LQPYTTFIMGTPSLIFTNNIKETLPIVLKEWDWDKIFFLTDDNTRKLCLPLIHLDDNRTIEIPSGDGHKNLDSLSLVWKALVNGGATRHSLLVNLGGGMVTDLGGFAAATFKRGIPFIHIPTTLLAMVDASTGGKTGVNFEGLKNELGVFAQSSKVIIDTTFLHTLDRENLASGFAEIIKHALIHDERMWHETINFDLFRSDDTQLRKLIRDSLKIKQDIVSKDPEEHGIRKALNLGHTAGHAFESLALKMQRPVLHGYAVAWGLVCELYLSCKLWGFPHDILFQCIQFVKEHYGVFAFHCDHYDTLIELMSHDKKNIGGDINFTLLSGIGNIHINQVADRDEITDMFDFYRETMGV